MASCASCTILTERLALLEGRVRQLEQSNVVTLDVADTSASVSCSELTSPACSSPKRPTSYGVPVETHNRFSSLASPTPQSTGHHTLVIGDSITRNIKLSKPATVKCIPGARAPDIEANLRELTRNRPSKHVRQANRTTNYANIVVHVGSNDTRMRQSEITKRNIARTCDLARKMSRHRVIVSGPLPARGNDERYSRLVSLNKWLASYCRQQELTFIDNWPSFWGKPGLLMRDGLHPNQEGAIILSRNIDYYLSLT
ncbi:uncharacterized protein LOC133659339 [Entelurus aequoreus]|uniref:uncharacterized protein LOC133659339 n=1 Tax=Entelurus aequoreus TaxID=161455 RepID=UPI002B1D30E0|nr:uncharacterized protein LOC133659339 [Entelurus aequoreus]